MKKQMQRILSLALCLLLCFSQIPAAAAQMLFEDVPTDAVDVSAELFDADALEETPDAPENKK